MRYAAATVAILAILSALSGCGRGVRTEPAPIAPPAGAPKPPSQVSGELVVYVNDALLTAYGAVKAAFAEKNPGVTITETDKPLTADVILDAGEGAIPAEALAAEPITWAYTALALIVAKQNPCKIASVKDVAGEAVKGVFVFHDEEPAGKAARKALKAAGVLNGLSGRLRDVASNADMVRIVSAGPAVGITFYGATQVMDRGNEAAKQAAKKVQLLGKIPADLTGEIPVLGGTGKASANPAVAEAFLQFLMTEDAQKLLRGAGLERAVKSTSDKEVVLYLYCGAGIRPFMDKAIDAYQAQHPEVTVEVGYAGSGCLLSQLAFAKRGDLYMPGEDYYIDQAKERGYLTAAKLVGYFDPVLLVQKGNPKGIRRIEDVLAPGIRMGVGEPDSAAVGRAAVQVFERAKITDKVQENIVFTAGNVPELGNAVKLKSLDVALVWNVTAAQVADSCDAVELPRKLYEPSEVPLGVLKFSEHPEQAQAFVDFCAGPEGQKLAAAAGMSPADREPSE